MLGDGPALLLVAQIDVGAGHLGGERDTGVVQVGLHGVRLIGGGFRGALLAAEEVDLPGGVETGVVERQVLAARTADDAAGDVGGEDAGADRGRRQHVALLLGQEGAGLAQAGLGRGRRPVGVLVGIENIVHWNGLTPLAFPSFQDNTTF